MSFGIVYCVTLIKDGRKYYGETIKSLEKRREGHLKDKRNFYFLNSLRKYGIDAFEWKIVEECDSEAQLFERETFYILRDRTNEKEFGFNSKVSGQGGKHTKETCEKISKALKGKSDHIPWKGKKRPLEVGQRISESLKKSEKQRARFANPENHPMFGVKGKDNPLFGRPRSKEAREAISKGKLGKKLPKEHGVAVSQALTGRKLSEEHKLNISRAVKGVKYVTIDGKKKRVSQEEYELLLRVAGLS